MRIEPVQTSVPPINRSTILAKLQKRRCRLLNVNVGSASSHDSREHGSGASTASTQKEFMCAMDPTRELAAGTTEFCGRCRGDDVSNNCTLSQAITDVAVT